ncbi:MAG: response regulator [Magnetococcales bacterium]|nr:response regulator [Magnetococcales bacterium]NGZ06634.1 response regulator [Magnetococcales bacterium]
MSKPLTFFMVDDDPFAIQFQGGLLEGAGHRVIATTSSTQALELLLEQPVDCVILDIMMPGLDGMALLQKLRSDPRLSNLKVVIVSGKQFDYDRERAYAFGVDGYLVKPVDPATFVAVLQEIIADAIVLRYWGVRGTLPVSGTKALHYGGNTSCVTLEFPRGELLIFDAGSGIKRLSDHLVAQKRVRQEAKIFISHPHWDHINALPFFRPLYQQGNEFEICGASHGDIDMRELIAAQMDGVYFPIKISEFAARVYFRNLHEEVFSISDRILMRTMLLNHPGNCLGYRVEYRDRSVCYITDNELYPKESAYYSAHYVSKLAEFVRGTDVLIIDATYTDKEYTSRIHWGHSSISAVVALAHQAQVKALHLFHHDPDQDDAAIAAKERAATAMLQAVHPSLLCLAPAEGACFRI